MAAQRVAATRPCPVLDNLPFLAGAPYDVQQLAGGLTNRNYRVTTESGADFVARFSGAKSEYLAIDRAAEAYNSRVAASIGVGPEVVEFVPGENLLVVRWVEGRTLDDAALDSTEMLTRIAHVCRRLHAGPRFLTEFDMFDVQRGYLRIVREQGFRLPGDYFDFGDQVRVLDEVLHASSSGTVACHNDLLSANIMDDGDRIWLIDFEYSGNNDACFELGNIWSEADLPDDRLEHLVASYFDAPSPVQTARARLFGLMAKYGWTLWASIQDAVSDVDFDFWQWGLEKYERAVAEFRSPMFDDLIETVREGMRHEGAQPWPTQSS
jgi:thiamine kinase-like enzyme